MCLPQLKFSDFLPKTHFFLPNDLAHLCYQLDDDMEWPVIKPHVFSAVMDFFSTGLPVLTDEQPSPDTCELFYLCSTKIN